MKLPRKLKKSFKKALLSFTERGPSLDSAGWKSSEVRIDGIGFDGRYRGLMPYVGNKYVNSFRLEQ